QSMVILKKPLNSDQVLTATEYHFQALLIMCYTKSEPCQFAFVVDQAGA
ncbi:hypothetical protein Lpp123_11451, partial [Lacticaseibacillus paracasei subsp. paracasei Lpp123]